MQHFRYFFTSGLDELKVSEIREVRSRLMQLISSGKRSTYYKFATNGWRDIPVFMYKAITDLFGEYGVEENKVWEIRET